jgi:tRNA threonylcarbamoyladenosine biosynthesis protein TsaB
VLILAFDTSGFAGSVALLKDGRLLASELLDRQQRSARSLAPAISRLLTGQQISAAQIGLVATTVGPGSFTGLRVGITTAKTLAYATRADLIGLSTLEVLAGQTPPELLAAGTGEIHALLDAQRQELFCGRFQYAAGPETIQRSEPDRIIAANDWLSALSAGTIVTGTGLDQLLERLPAGTLVVPPPLREPLAVTVGQLAWRAHLAGRRDDPWTLAPAYLRPSYAEEKRTRARG